MCLAAAVVLQAHHATAKHYLRRFDEGQYLAAAVDLDCMNGIIDLSVTGVKLNPDSQTLQFSMYGLPSEPSPTLATVTSSAWGYSAPHQQQGQRTQAPHPAARDSS